MYKLIHWTMYNYDELTKPNAIDKKYNPKTKQITTYSRYIIMVDTETSKSQKDSYVLDKFGRKKWNTCRNYVVAFTISIRLDHENIVTLYGNRPDECIQCMKKINSHIFGMKKFFFIFNLSYDYWFLRKFLFEEFGYPERQLNLDAHYPISIEFSNGLILKDAYVLAQRKLEKWCQDLGVEDQKTSGWDYDQIRRQDEMFDIDELEYIEHDTLAGVECIDKLLMTLNNCKLKDIPFTATGIARRSSYRIGRKHNAKSTFNKLVLTKEQYLCFEASFHGGYTHCNRFLASMIFTNVKCFDFASSYPFVVCSERFPMSRFEEIYGYYTIEDILKTHDKFAYMFKLTLVNVRLRDPEEQMPVLQASKNIANISYDDTSSDNGRILSCTVYEGYMNDIDLELVNSQYIADYAIISELKRSEYGYLPRWFTDHVYKLYEDKCKLKNGDPVLYDITKAQLNSVAYGMIAMHNIKELIVEDYATGEYKEETGHSDELYEKFISNRKNIYPYQWSCWVTSYAQKNLHQLGKCCDRWIYSDTDSCFSDSWHQDQIDAYNMTCRQKLSANGYEPITVNGKTFYLGETTLDKTCDRFKALHSKCYAYESEGQISITVAGVPKKTGRKCIRSLEDFNEDTVFDGLITGKKTHVYHTEECIFEEDGIIYGDSVDLIPCDYSVKGVRIDDMIDYTDLIPEIVESMCKKVVYSRVMSYE